MHLVWPARDYLPSYVAALNRGWTPDNVRGDFARLEELGLIHRGAQCAAQEGKEGKLLTEYMNVRVSAVEMHTNEAAAATAEVLAYHLTTLTVMGVASVHPENR